MFSDDFLTFHQRAGTRLANPAASHGQCLPGAEKCMVDIDGLLYMCERVGENRPLGSVWEGYQSEKITALLLDYNKLFNQACRNCWAVRLCNKCFVHFRHGEEFDAGRLESFCRSMRKRWHWVIGRYCELREQEQNIFHDLLENLQRR